MSHHDAIAVSFLHAPAPMHTNLFVGGASVVDDDVNVVNNLVELMVVGIVVVWIVLHLQRKGEQ